MTTVQESGRSPQLQIPRGSPSSSITRSPSQLGVASSPSPSRKRTHPNYLKIDDAAPPNKKLNTPTEEEKETIMKEKEMLYKRLAEEKRAPFYLTPFPILPLNNKFNSISPSIYSFLQQQQQQHQQQQQTASPPRLFPANFTLSPSASVDLSRSKLPSNLMSSSAALTANSPGSNSSIIGNTTGISGLPTPGGSSVGTPPRTLYPSQLYPTSLLKFPFSPPTPSSLGILSPWNFSNRSMSISSSTATPGPPNSNESLTGDGSGMLQCLSGSCSSDTLVTSTPKTDTDSPADSGGAKRQSQSHSPSNNATTTKSQPSGGLMTGIAHSPWPVSAPVPAPAIQSKPHLYSSHPHHYAGSIQSPLGMSQPFSPAMQTSPYPGSVSSCPSVSSSSGCSSSSEIQESHPGTSSLLKNYVLSEYHVGPHRLIEKDLDNQSEEATTSGRNTPIDPVAEDSVNGVLPSDVARKLMSSGQYHGSLTSTAQPSSGKGRVHSSKHPRTPKSNSPHPFSVESISSSCQPSPINPQGYISGCHIVDRPSSGVSSMSSSLSSRDSTPDPEELKHDPTLPPQGMDVFCLVPGRLSLLSSTQKYKVTVDEVRRRLSHPECLNASVLGGILRRAKSKNGGTVLRQRLQEIGVSLPPGRRKQTELSLLTSLVESESLHLASDFHRTCDNFFPHAELGQIIARQHVGTPEAQHRISMVKATQLIVSELQAMLDAVGGPSNIRPNNPSNPYPGLTNFSLISHGFGNPAINTGLGVLQTYLQELLAYYEGSKSIQAPDNRYLFTGENSPQMATSAPPPHHLGMGPELMAPMQHGNLPQHHPLQNPLLYATRHYPPGNAQEAVSSSNAAASEGVTLEVTLKEEPLESPNSFTS